MSLCKLCNGQLALLGDLGMLRWLRCVSCGMEWSVKRRLRKRRARA